MHRVVGSVGNRLGEHLVEGPKVAEMSDEVLSAVRKVFAAVERQRKQSLSEAVSSGWRARDEVLNAAHDLHAAYSAVSREGA